MRTDRRTNTHGGANLRHCMIVMQEKLDRDVKHAVRHFILYGLLTEVIPGTECGQVKRSKIFFLLGLGAQKVPLPLNVTHIIRQK